MKIKNVILTLIALTSFWLLSGCTTKRKVVHKTVIHTVSQKKPWHPGHYTYYKGIDTAIIKAISFYGSKKITIKGAFLDGEVHVEDGKVLDNDSSKNVYKRIDTSRAGRLAVPVRSLAGPMGTMTITFSADSDKTYRLTFHAERNLFKDRNGRMYVIDTVFVLDRHAKLFYQGKWQNVTVETENNERCILLFYDLHSISTDTVEEEAGGVQGGNTAPKKKKQ